MKHARPTPHHSQRQARRPILWTIWRNRKGVAAIEFSLLLFPMFVFFFGLVEVTFLSQAQRKASLVSATITDLTSRAVTVDGNELTDIFNASQAIMAPLDLTGLQLRVSSVYVDSQSRARIRWSQARGTSARASNSVVADIPFSLTVPGSSFVFTEVTYPFRSPFGFLPSRTLQAQHYFRPRLADEVNYAGGTVS